MVFFLPGARAHSWLLPQGAGTNSEQTGRLLLRRAWQKAGLELQETSLVPGLLNNQQCVSFLVCIRTPWNKQREKYEDFYAVVSSDI